jgi:hypothetical protein
MSLRSATRALPALLFACLLAVACQGQGEGAPCDLNNGVSGDCQSGLTCQPIRQGDAPRCCPTTGTSSSPDCSRAQAGGDANAPPAGDSGAEEAGPDAAGQADGEAGPEAAPSTDAEAGPVDSASDSPDAE